jgi:hypothetical protein
MSTHRLSSVLASVYMSAESSDSWSDLSATVAISNQRISTESLSRLYGYRERGAVAGCVRDQQPEPGCGESEPRLVRGVGAPPAPALDATLGSQLPPTG